MVAYKEAKCLATATSYVVGGGARARSSGVALHTTRRPLGELICKNACSAGRAVTEGVHFIMVMISPDESSPGWRALSFGGGGGGGGKKIIGWLGIASR